MKLLRGIKKGPAELLFTQGSVATIGNFDGVHKGHQSIVAHVVNKAKDLKLPSVVILFEPQPKEFFAPDKAPARIPPLREFRPAASALRNLKVERRDRRSETVCA